MNKNPSFSSFELNSESVGHSGSGGLPELDLTFSTTDDVGSKDFTDKLSSKSVVSYHTLSMERR